MDILSDTRHGDNAKVRIGNADPKTWLAFLGSGSGRAICPCAVNATAQVVVAGVADRINLAPVHIFDDLSVTTAYINVSTALASSNAKIVIYEQLDRASPVLTLVYSSADIDCSTTGTKTVSLSFTFGANRRYYVGVHTSGTQSLRGLAVGGMAAFNNTMNGSTANNMIQTSAPYASGAPSTITVTATMFASGSFCTPYFNS